MASLFNFALCFLSVASALHIRQPLAVAIAKARMQSAPQSIEVQQKGCNELSQATYSDRVNPAAFGGLEIAKHWLTEGYGEAVSQGLLNILATPQGVEEEESVFQAAQACFSAILAAKVQNNADLGLALYRNSPHLWDAFVGYFRRFKNDSRVVGGKIPLIMFAGLYGSFPGEDEVALGLDRAGGYELILEILEENYKNAATVQAATGALSDNVQCSQSAADAVVRNNGVKILTKAVKEAYGLEHYHDEFYYGLRYEILEDIIGLLKHDDENRTTRDAFIEAGLMEAVIKFMPEEPNDLYFQDHCCQTFNFLTNGNVTLQRRLAGSDAAVSLVKKAATVPCAPACRWPTTLARDANSLPPACKFTLENLEGAGTDWKEYSDSSPHA